MMVTDRQARNRLAAAVAAAGGQKAFREAHGLSEKKWASALSKALCATLAPRDEVLAAVGLRRDQRTGVIHTVTDMERAA